MPRRSCFLVGFLVLAACGGDRRPPPIGFPPAVPVTSKTERKIRVLLKESFAATPIEGSSLGTGLTVRSDAGRIRLLHGKKNQTGSGFRIDPAPGELLKVEGSIYRGSLEAFINPVGTPVLVNEVGLEEYLKGVLPHELSPRAPGEAVKAQAIAARTYAVFSLGQNANRGFDVFTDERSQVYRGASKEHPLSNKAIEETRGVVAVYQEKPIFAVYSSTCGGKTESYELMFQRKSIPYLKGGADCPDGNGQFSSWEERIPIARVQPQVDRLAQVGRLRKLAILERTPSKRVLEMRFAGDKGEKILKGNDVRFALSVRSTWIVELDPKHDDSGYITEIHVKGRGWGHGVGLCQIGAVELAKKGWSFEKILKHYYAGIKLVRQY